MKMMTPLVQLPVGDALTWSYYEFAKSQERGPLSLLLKPTVLETNWCVFDDRWHPILNSFDTCYANPSIIWTPARPLPALAGSSAG
jgi:hypothetical protein